MNVDVYIFLRFGFFQNFLSFLCSVLHVSPDIDPSRRDRSISVPAESAAETATVNHGDDSWRMCVDSIEIPIARLDMKADPVSSRNSPL